MTHPAGGDPIETYVRGRDFQMLVGGEFVPAADGATSEVHDPSTGATVAAVPEASPEDVINAVEVARKAQPAWEALGVDGRSACFEHFGRLLLERMEEL